MRHSERRDLLAARGARELAAGGSAGLRWAQREKRDRQIVPWNLGRDQNEVGASLHIDGIVYKPSIRDDKADYIIEISIIENATDPRRIWGTSVCE